MATELATVNLEEVARRKAAFLLLVRDAMAEKGIDVDLKAGATRAVEHIAKAGEFSHRDLRAQSKMMARFVLGVSLGLECATKGVVIKAIAALTKNPVEMLYLIGEKMLTELKERADKVAANAVVSTMVDAHHRGYFGVTDYATDTLIHGWSTNGFNDAHGLPPGTMTEYTWISSTLDRVEKETRLAKLVHWEPILKETGITQFPSIYFRRSERNVPSPAGGVLAPLFCSLGVNAFVGSWDSQVDDERRGGDAATVSAHAFLVPENIQSFVELLFSDDEKTAENREIQVVVCASKLLRKPGFGEGRIFVEPVVKSDLRDEILFAIRLATSAFAQACRGFAEEAQKEEPPTALDAQQLQAYWMEKVDAWARPQLFVYVPDWQNRRVAETRAIHEPWNAIPDAKSFDEVVRILKDFPHWPIATRMTLAGTLDISRWVRKDVPRRTAAERVLTVWNQLLAGLKLHYPIPFLGIDWNNHETMLLEIAQKEGTGSSLRPWIVAVAKNRQWERGVFARIDRDFPSALLPLFSSILPVVASDLSLADWKHVIESVEQRPTETRLVWDGLTATQRAELLLTFRAGLLGKVLQEEPWQDLEPIFKHALQLCQDETGETLAFHRWAIPHRGDRLFPHGTSHAEKVLALIRKAEKRQR